jgi:hypothetical protein
VAIISNSFQNIKISLWVGSGAGVGVVDVRERFGVLWVALVKALEEFGVEFELEGGAVFVAVLAVLDCCVQEVCCYLSIHGEFGYLYMWRWIPPLFHLLCWCCLSGY